MGSPQLVQLEIDEKDKETFQELQQGMQQAKQELQMVSMRLRMRQTEHKQALLTLSELDEIADSSPAYVQVGKMFLQQPLSELKQNLRDKATSASSDIESSKKQQEMVEETAKKVEADFQDFVRAHMVEVEQPKE